MTFLFVPCCIVGYIANFLVVFGGLEETCFCNIPYGKAKAKAGDGN